MLAIERFLDKLLETASEDELRGLDARYFVMRGRVVYFNRVLAIEVLTVELQHWQKCFNDLNQGREKRKP